MVTPLVGGLVVILLVTTVMMFQAYSTVMALTAAVSLVVVLSVARFWKTSDARENRSKWIKLVTLFVLVQVALLVYLWQLTWANNLKATKQWKNNYDDIARLIYPTGRVFDVAEALAVADKAQDTRQRKGLRMQVLASFADTPYTTAVAAKDVDTAYAEFLAVNMRNGVLNLCAAQPTNFYPWIKVRQLEPAQVLDALNDYNTSPASQSQQTCPGKPDMLAQITFRCTQDWKPRCVNEIALDRVLALKQDPALAGEVTRILRDVWGQKN